MPLKQIPDHYKRFDDAKILLVDHCHVSSNYKKPLAVSARSILNGLLEHGYEIVQDKKYVPYIDGKEKICKGVGAEKMSQDVFFDSPRLFVLLLLFPLVML